MRDKTELNRCPAARRGLAPLLSLDGEREAKWRLGCCCRGRWLDLPPARAEPELAAEPEGEGGVHA